jgi:hypothetical protein
MNHQFETPIEVQSERLARRRHVQTEALNIHYPIYDLRLGYHILSMNHEFRKHLRQTSCQAPLSEERREARNASARRRRALVITLSLRVNPTLIVTLTISLTLFII